MPLKDVLWIALDVAAGLELIHSQNVIHKDLCPNNIVVNQSERLVQIIDFGSATKLSRDPTVPEHLSCIGGTLPYVSPEQTGRTSRGIDYRTDFFSFGVALYEMVTGTLPFTGLDLASTVHLILAAQPKSPRELRPECPEPLARLILKLLEKDPERRYRSAAGLKHDLEACRRLVAGESIAENFALGTTDRTSRFELPDRLYGRESQCQNLLAAFERVALGTTEFIKIGGASGTGKSALVAELRQPMVARRGIFGAGKFDLYRRNQPLSAVSAALSQIVDGILRESESTIAAYRDAIKASVAQHGRTVTELIPSLELLLGSCPPETPTDPASAKNRLLGALERLVRIFATREHPLVIFLDDLQWADALSLEVLAAWARPGGPRHVLFIVAYRDNEIDATHPARYLFDTLATGQVPATQVSLTALGEVAIAEMISDMTACDETRARELATCITRKTTGNAFSVRTFLRHLHARGLVTYDHAAKRWSWELAQIAAEGVSDGIAPILVSSMRRLGLETSNALQLAACIGSRFELQSLAELTGTSITRVARDLYGAIDAGLVIPLTSSFIQIALASEDVEASAGEPIVLAFAHDQVRAAAHAAMSPESRQATHRTLGKRLLASLTAEQLEAQVFTVADHLNQASLPEPASPERLKLARVNLQAGERAHRACAYESSEFYLNQALALISPNPWTTAYEIAAAAHLALAKTYLALNKYPQGLALLHDTSRTLLSPLELARACELRGAYHDVQTEYEQCISSCLDGLRVLGIPLSTNISHLRLGLQIARFRMLWMRRIIRRLEVDSVPNDERWQLIVALAFRMAPAAFFTNQNLFVFIAIHLYIVAEREGVTLNNPALSMVLGMVCAIIRDPRSALVLREISYRQRRGAESMSPGVAPVADGHWISTIDKSYEELVVMTHDGFQGAVDSGDLGYGGALAFLTVLTGLGGGHRLPDLEAMANRYLAFFAVKSPGNHFFTPFFAVRQLVRNLAGATLRADTMSDEQIAEEIIVDRAVSPGDKSLYQTMRAWIDFNNRDYRSAARRGLRNYPQLVLPGCFSAAFNVTITVLSRIRMDADETPNLARRLATWALARLAILELGWWNVPKHVTTGLRELVRGELALSRGKTLSGLRYLELALAKFARSKAYYWVAETHETIGAAFERLGFGGAAALHARKAITAFQAFGAMPRATQLERRFAALLRRHEAEGRALAAHATSAHSTMDAASSGIDIESMIKASQAIYQEIDPLKSVEELLRLTVENAGANFGALVTCEDAALRIRGVHRIAGTQVEGPATRLIDIGSDSATFAESVAARVVHYVAQTGRSLLVNQVTASEFALDPYVRKAKPKAMLCLPLTCNARTDAILFLTNDVLEGAFTKERVASLGILAAPAAISLRNAGFLQEIRQSAERLEFAAKMSAIGEMAAEVAHEINNPVAVIHGAAMTLQSMAQGNKLDVEGLSQEISTVERTATRISRMVKSIRSLARDGSRDPFEPECLGQLVEETLDLCRRRAQDRGIRIELAVPPDDVVVECQAGRFSQVVMNLVNNAIDAVMAASDRWIRVTLVADASGVTLSVVDSGPGIPRELLGKIMEPYVTTKGHGKGLGLGLSISKRIAETHGGRLWIDTSCPNTCFTLFLPERQSLPVQNRAA